MKNIKIYIFTVLMILTVISACKDEDLELIPEWESGVHGFIAVAAGSGNAFNYQQSDNITFDFQWISIDGAVQIEKIDFYIMFTEPYVDADGNPKNAAIGGDDGVLFKTLEGSEVPGNREIANISVSQDEVYALYQNHTFDYDGDSIDENGDGTCDKGCSPAIPVFGNPATPDRVPGGRFIEGDAFEIRWEFTATDGRVFNAWGISVCTEFPGANCSFNWNVLCPFDYSKFVGSYTADESGYGTYAVTVTQVDSNTIAVANFWDAGVTINYEIDGVDGTATIPSQNFVLGGTTYTVTGSGTINNCNGGMTVDYVVTEGATTIDENTHTYTKN